MHRWMTRVLVITLGCGLAPVSRASMPHWSPEPGEEVSYAMDNDPLAIASKAPGTPTNSIFAGFDKNESVSLFNGNLVVSHVASAMFAMDGGMSIGLVRTYNSKNSRNDVFKAFDRHPSSWQDEVYYGRSWVGVGWTMHLGRIFEKSFYNQDSMNFNDKDLMFEDPKGTQHRLDPFPSHSPVFKHEETTFQELVCEGGPYAGQECCIYGRDCEQWEGATCDCEMVTFERHWLTHADGTVRMLETINPAETHGDFGYISNADRSGAYTRSITDVHGNRVDIEYHGDLVDNQQPDVEYPEAIKAIKIFEHGEGLGRLVLWTDLWDAGDEECVMQTAECVPAAFGMLRSLSHLGPDGTTVQQKYVYAAGTVHESVADGSGTIEQNTVATLVRVDLPEIDDLPAGSIGYAYGQIGGGEEGSRLRPLLRKITYPTGGVSEYEYKPYIAGSRDGTCQHFDHFPIPDIANECYWRGWPTRKELGVRKRTLYPEGDGPGQPYSTWEWRREFQRIVDEPGLVNQFEMTYPDGRTMRARYGGNPWGSDDSDGHCVGQAHDCGPHGYELKQVTYEADGVTPIQTRETSYDYTMATRPGGSSLATDLLTRQTTVTYHDDPGASGVECFGAGYQNDGTGNKQVTTTHYQRRDTTVSGVDVRDRFKLTRMHGDYLKLPRLSYTDLEDPVGCRAENFVLGAAAFSFVQEGDQRVDTRLTGIDCQGSVTEARVSPVIVTGAATGPQSGAQWQHWDEWTVDAPSGSATDVVHESDYDDVNGNLESKTFSGGDSGGNTYGVSYFWDRGKVVKAEIDGLSHPSSELEFDAAGFVSTSTDPNGLVSSYEYDALGRPKRITPPGQELPTRVVYPSLLETRIIRSDGIETSFNSGDPDQVYSEQRFDGLGRVIETRRAMPNNTLTVQVTGYDQTGRVIFTSEPIEQGAYTTAATTEWSSPGGEYEVTVPLHPTTGQPWGTVTFYGTNAVDGNPLSVTPDAFGRVRKVVSIDGSTVETEYCGPHREVTVRGVETLNGPEDAVTRYYHDGLGRLVVVDTPAGGADAEYDYDLNGNIVRVNLIEDGQLPADPFDAWKAGQIPTGQTREFVYDALGQLRSASHPENGTTTFDGYEAQGKLLRQRDALGAARGYHHKMTYDVAGRLLTAERVTDDHAPGFSATYTAGDADWVATGFDTADGEDCLGESAWYVGGGDCRYAQGSAQQSSLTLAQAITLPANVHLSFRYFREVRQSTKNATDSFKVEVTTDNWTTSTVLYFQDASHSSWSRWRRSPAISLHEFAGQQVLIRFHFNSHTNNFSNPLLRGIGISDIRLEQPAAFTISENVYDEDHGSSGNHHLGQLTTSRRYDESTQQASYVRKLLYEGAAGQLSKEFLILDWDRDSNGHTFDMAYAYDAFGALSSKVLPDLHAKMARRSIGYQQRRGALVAVTSDDGSGPTDIVPDSGFASGIEYTPAGAMRMVPYGNGLESSFDVNPANLPERIRVARSSGGPSLLDSGSYTYDGARNITGIGDDDYRYDEHGRITRAKVTSDLIPTGLFIDYFYDHLGNMTDRLAGFSAGSYTDEGPEGLDFSGRQYSDNQLDGTGYSYDANGNLLEDGEVGLAGQRYVYSPENEVRFIEDRTSSGKFYMEAQYDGGGNRWVRFTDTSLSPGEALLTLRDASGAVVAEYVEINDTLGPILERHYVHGNGRILATHKDCGPAPEISVSAVTSTSLVVDKIDHFPVGAGYRIVIQAEDGTITEIPEPNTLPAQFSVDLTHFSATGHHWLRLQSNTSCGWTGYSNAISFSQEATPSSCVQATALGYRDFVNDQDPDATLQLRGYATCGGLYRYKVLLGEVGGLQFEVATNLLTPELDIESTGLSAGFGHYSFVEYHTQTGAQGTSHVGVIKDERNAENASHQIPGISSFKTQYLHWDHLGSTRLVTDELGFEVSEHKYYPFGHEVASTSTTMHDPRIRFTGHERDTTFNLDYMLARYHGAHLGRFLSTDPGDDTQIESPQSWNKYVYVGNNPMVRVDPDGRAAWGVVAKVGKIVIKGGDIASTFAGMLQDVETLKDPTASTGEKIKAGVSLASEIFSPVSARDAKAVAGFAKKVKGGERGVIVHPSQRAARRGAEREAGMGRHGGRESLPDQPLRPGSQSPQGPPGTRTETRSTDTGRTVHHDPYGHRDGNIPPHYGVDGPGIEGTTHHTYPTSHDPSTNR